MLAPTLPAPKMQRGETPTPPFHLNPIGTTAVYFFEIANGKLVTLEKVYISKNPIIEVRVMLKKPNSSKDEFDRITFKLLKLECKTVRLLAEVVGTLTLLTAELRIPQ